MRTNIEIDNALMKQALSASGSQTKKQAVEAGLRLLIRLKAQSEIRKVKGMIPFYDDVLADRLHRF